MTLLDVQHIKKIYKTRFQGTQVEALKDIHFTVEKGEYVAIRGNQDPGNPPSSISCTHAGPADRRTGLPQWHRYLNHQKQGRIELPPWEN